MNSSRVMALLFSSVAISSLLYADVGPFSTATEAIGSPRSEAAATPSSAGGVDASRVTLPCIPVGTYWAGDPPPSGVPAGPDLAVVQIDVRPKNARVHLDGEFIGRARYFNGKKGYLYLEPGSYRLELRGEGYRTVTVELTAEARCRYDLKHFMDKDPGSAAEADTFGKGRPTVRVFGPQPSVAPAERATTSSARPDPTLRPDLSEQRRTEVHRNASLRLVVSPGSAEVRIDGVFVATARELSAMEGPLAVAAGSRRLEIRATGHLGWARTIELEEGQTLELEVALDVAEGE